MKWNDFKSKIHTLRKIIRFSAKADKNRNKILALGVVVGFLREGSFLAGTFLPALIVNLIIDRENIAMPIVAACGISAIMSIIDYIVETNLRRISNLSVSSISYKILSLNQKYMTMRYDLISTTEAYNRYDKATDAIFEISDTEYIMYSHFLPKVFSLISLVSVFLNVDLLAAIIVCASVAIEMLLGSKSEEVDFNAREQVSESERKFSHILSNLLNPTYSRDLKAYSSESFFSKQIEGFRHKYIDAIKIREGKKLKYSLFSSVNIFIRLITIYILALFKFSKGILPIGDFLLYINASNSLFETMEQMKNDILYLDRVIFYYQDIELFEAAESSPASRTDIAAPNTDIPEIEFVNVSFTYPNQNKKALDNVSIKIYNKEKIALVGENGSGKTTLVKLLLKLYRPDEGVILLRGKNIDEIDDETYFRHYAPVFQDFQLFLYTIKENVAFSNDDDEGVINALDQASLKQKVLQLPKGINTHYSTRFYEDGVEFSGGEKQLLALSRALYKNSPVMILDEPTAALDPLHEKAVFDLFASQSKDKTAIYISHRMSASRLADRIILLKDGKLCESGTHRELIELSGEYAELWNMQSQWYA